MSDGCKCCGRLVHAQLSLLLLLVVTAACGASAAESIEPGLARLEGNVRRRHTQVATVLETMEEVQAHDKFLRAFASFDKLCSNNLETRRACRMLGVSSCDQFKAAGGLANCTSLLELETGCGAIDKYCTKCLDVGLNATIDFAPYENYAELAVQNANFLSELLHHQILPNGYYPAAVDGTGGGSFASSSCDGGHNFFGAANIVFQTRTKVSILSHPHVFGVGMCIANGSFTDPMGCHYTARKGNSTNDLIYTAHDPLPQDSSRPEPPWFTVPRDRIADLLQKKNRTELEAYHVYFPHEISDQFDPNAIRVGYDPNLWSLPYYDCALGHRWMVTYSAPVLYYHDSQIRYLGITGVDIDLSKIPINQCSASAVTNVKGTGFEKLFSDTHLCDPVSTVCEPKPINLFITGSYVCRCRDGFYKANTPKDEQFFEGYNIEPLDEITGVKLSNFSNEELDEFVQKRARLVLSKLSTNYSCIPCPPGCDTCVTGEEVCLYVENKAIIYSLTAVTLTTSVLALVLLVFVVRNRRRLVIRAASWPFLVILIVGTLVAYGNVVAAGLRKETHESCLTYQWLFSISFAACYGAIFIKTWRLWKIFARTTYRGKRRSARLTDKELFVRLGIIILVTIVMLTLLTVSTAKQPKTVQNSAGQKYTVCQTHAMADVMQAGKKSNSLIVKIAIIKPENSGSRTKASFLMVLLTCIFLRFFCSINLTSYVRQFYAVDNELSKDCHKVSCQNYNGSL